jgi:hypothetical protein
MTWKGMVVLALVLLIMVGLLNVLRGCLAEDSRADVQERQDWMNFVIQHHCSVIPTRWYEANRWQCDGFQVEHN